MLASMSGLSLDEKFSFYTQNYSKALYLQQVFKWLLICMRLKSATIITYEKCKV